MAKKPNSFRLYANYMRQTIVNNIYPMKHDK